MAPMLNRLGDPSADEKGKADRRGWLQEPHVNVHRISTPWLFPGA
jgi:hypothetical protein